MRKKNLLPLLLFSSIAVCFGQDHPQGLIYAAQFTADKTTKYDLYSETGKKLFKEPLLWVWSNSWDWIFTGTGEKGPKKAYDYTGTKLLIDSISGWKAPAVSTNRIPIKKNGKWGYYNKSGELKIPLIYENASAFIDNKAIVKQNGIVLFVDSNGTVLNLHYKYDDPVYNFEDEDISVGMSGFENPDFIIVEKGPKKGLANAQNEILIPALYDDILGLKEYFKQVTVEQNGKYGVVSFGNQVLVPIKYDEVYVLNDYLKQ